MARERKACAGLVGGDAAYAEEAIDFGCVVGGGDEVMQRRILNERPILSKNDPCPYRIISNNCAMFAKPIGNWQGREF